jgi:outer membrane protein assembly factor BamB
VLPDGDVLYGVGGLVRLDGRTGRPRWSFPGVTVYGPMAVGTGVVVLTAVTDRGSDLLAVDLATGQERWRRPLVPALLVGPAASGDTVVAVGATGDVVALDAATGRELWTATLRTAPGGTPAILGDRVVLSEVGRDEDLLSRDTRLTVYDLRTGRYLGSQEPPGFAFTRGTFGVAGDAVVTGTVTSAAAVMVLRPQ